jgi:hypothetical protein
MDKKPLIGVSICAVVLLVLGSLTNVVGYQTVKSSNQNTVISKSHVDDIIIQGTMGENGWYISTVIVTFVGGNYTYFRIDYGDWTLYTGPFSISTDGIHLIEATYDFEHIYNVTIKIDRTPPDWIGFFIDKIGYNKYRIYAEVSDATSGVNRVEFYLNDYLIYTVYEAPYEWFYKGPSFNYNSIVFDNAGNLGLPSIIPRGPITYFAIGFINNPQFSEYGGTFFAEFVIVIEHSFPVPLFHISTLTHQQFAFYDYKGYISENFMIVKSKG